MVKDGDRKCLTLSRVGTFILKDNPETPRFLNVCKPNGSLVLGAVFPTLIMVKCFLIHTLCPVGALSPKESRILYSRLFEPVDKLPRPGKEHTPEEKRLLEKEQLAVIARQVRSACAQWREAVGRPAVELVVGEETAALQEADSGVLRLPAGEPFPGPSCVLWLGIHALAFTMVCQPEENMLLAEGTLRSLACHALENLRLLGSGSEVLLKKDRMEALLHHVLPHGELLFLNHRFAQNLDKEVAACLSK